VTVLRKNGGREGAEMEKKEMGGANLRSRDEYPGAGYLNEDLSRNEIK